MVMRGVIVLLEYRADTLEKCRLVWKYIKGRNAGLSVPIS